MEEAKREAASYHKDLLEIKHKIMDLTQRFDRGRAAGEKKKKKDKKNQDEQWKGSEDVEKLSAIFMNYLTQTKDQRGDRVAGDSPKTSTNKNTDGGGKAAASQK